MWFGSKPRQFCLLRRAGHCVCEVRLTDAQLAEIIEKTANGDKFEAVYCVDMVDAADKIIAIVDKTRYIRRKVKGCEGKSASVS